MLSRVDSDWLYGEQDGRRGQFPVNFVNRVPDNLPEREMEEPNTAQVSFLLIIAPHKELPKSNVGSEMKTFIDTVVAGCDVC